HLFVDRFLAGLGGIKINQSMRDTALLHLPNAFNARVGPDDVHYIDLALGFITDNGTHGAEGIRVDTYRERQNGTEALSNGMTHINAHAFFIKGLQIAGQGRQDKGFAATEIALSPLPP